MVGLGAGKVVFRDRRHHTSMSAPPVEQFDLLCAGVTLLGIVLIRGSKMVGCLASIPQLLAFNHQTNERVNYMPRKTRKLTRLEVLQLTLKAVSTILKIVRMACELLGSFRTP